MAPISPRPIKRLLVANRGEIATRIISAARELDIETFAVYTENDVGHAYNATHALNLKSPSSYLSILELVDLVKEYGIDAVHPGYGFLSESAKLAERMAEIDVMVVGPGSLILEQTGDKLKARLLAINCNVPVLPAMTEPTGHVEAVKVFVQNVGLPVMVKAVDGGGGRGIRLIRKSEDLESFVKRAIEESPSNRVFAEKAAVDGFRHVEVQIIGDHKGNVIHLWERECSIQRRYQKLVEVAPSTVKNRKVIVPVIEAAVRMAKKINYKSLGTFEFLLNPQTKEFYFLEINPRLQVEHTITESICSIDIVKAQLQLAQGASFAQVGLADMSQDPLQVPGLHSVQLRITAEDPEKNYSLSIGKIQLFQFPSGNGTRVDTALHNGVPAVMSADFDSVIAKIIVTAKTWEDVISKARRALDDVTLKGIRTNVALMAAIITHRDFQNGACDTQWLEAKHIDLLTTSRKIFEQRQDLTQDQIPWQKSFSTSATAVSGPSTLFRKGDAWSISLKHHLNSGTTQLRHVQLTKVLRNDFPSTFAAEILFTTVGEKPIPYTIELNSTSASASSASSQHLQGSRSDSTHIILPLSGKLVEVLVDIGDVVRKDQVICVVKQMKMEIEVRSHKSGTVTWITDADDGEEVAEGMLAAIVEDEKAQAKL